MIQDIELFGVDRIAISPSGFAIDKETGQSFQVDEVGLAALAELRSRRSPAEVAKSLADEYEVSEGQARAGLESFIGRLQRYLG